MFAFRLVFQSQVLAVDNVSVQYTGLYYMRQKLHRFIFSTTLSDCFLF